VRPAGARQSWGAVWIAPYGDSGVSDEPRREIFRRHGERRVELGSGWRRAIVMDPKFHLRRGRSSVSIRILGSGFILRLINR